MTREQKIADEQELRMRSEINANLSMYDFQISQMDANGLSLRVDAWKRMYVKHVDFLLSSEQAWKEENANLRSWLKNAEAKEREYDNLRRRFDQAIEVLNETSDQARKHADPHCLCPDCRASRRIRDFLSSLQEDKT